MKNDFKCYDLVMSQILLTKGHLINWVKINKEDGKMVFFFQWDSSVWQDARQLIQMRKDGKPLIPYSKEVAYHDDEYGWTMFKDGTKLLDSENPLNKNE